MLAMRTRFLLLWAAGLLLLRFLFPGTTLFVLDEPLFQAKAAAALREGIFPLTSFRASSLPLPYGGGALWFYMLLKLVSSSQIFVVLAHVTLQVAGVLLFLRVIARAYGRETMHWCAPLVASSPLLFLFSRHPWDNTLFIPLGSLCLFLLQEIQTRRRLWLAAALGLAVGYALNIHLMFGPVALALGLTLLISFGWRYAFLFCAAAGFSLLPYGLAAWGESSFSGAGSERWGDGRNLWWLFLRATLFPSLYGSRLFFDQVKESFFAFSWLGFFYRVDLFGWFGKVAVWVSAGFVFRELLWRRKTAAPVDPLRLFAAMALLLGIFVYQFLNIATEPHYFNPLWWAAFVGIAWAISALRGRWRVAFLASLVGAALVNSAFDVEALAYLRRNHGTRGTRFGVSLGEQLRVMREICATARSEGQEYVRLDLATEVFSPQAGQYWLQHLPECDFLKTYEANFRMTFANFRVKHGAGRDDAGLIVDKLPPPP